MKETQCKTSVELLMCCVRPGNVFNRPPSDTHLTEMDDRCKGETHMQRKRTNLHVNTDSHRQWERGRKTHSHRSTTIKSLGHPNQRCPENGESKQSGWNCSHGNKVINDEEKGLAEWQSLGWREGREKPCGASTFTLARISETNLWETGGRETYHREASMVKTSAWGLVKTLSSSGSEERWANRRNSTWQKSNTHTHKYFRTYSTEEETGWLTNWSNQLLHTYCNYTEKTHNLSLNVAQHLTAS